MALVSRHLKQVLCVALAAAGFGVGCRDLAAPAGWVSRDVAGSRHVAVVGTARFEPDAPGYQSQATLTDVAPAATVSILDSLSNKTIATALTDASGAFILSLAQIVPDPSKVYILEAVKGLGSNKAGKSSVRIRTMIRFVAGTASWESITVGSVFITPYTTALAIIASHRNLDSAPFVGSLLLGSPPIFTPGTTGVTLAELSTVVGLVNSALVADVDPVYSIIYTAGAYRLRTGGGFPEILYVNPNPMSTGGQVTLVGPNFDVYGFANSVSFDSLPATILSVGSASLTVQVPARARSGTLTLVSPGGTATASVTVVGELDGLTNPLGNGVGAPGGPGPGTGSIPGFLGGFGPTGFQAGYSTVSLMPIARATGTVPAVGGGMVPTGSGPLASSPPPPVGGGIEP